MSSSLVPHGVTVLLRVPPADSGRRCRGFRVNELVKVRRLERRGPSRGAPLVLGAADAALAADGRGPPDAARRSSGARAQSDAAAADSSEPCRGGLGGGGGGGGAPLRAASPRFGSFGGDDISSGFSLGVFAQRREREGGKREVRAGLVCVCVVCVCGGGRRTRERKRAKIGRKERSRRQGERKIVKAFEKNLSFFWVSLSQPCPFSKLSASLSFPFFPPHSSLLSPSFSETHSLSSSFLSFLLPPPLPPTATARRASSPSPLFFLPSNLPSLAPVGAFAAQLSRRRRKRSRGASGRPAQRARKRIRA